MLYKMCKERKILSWQIVGAIEQGIDLLIIFGSKRNKAYYRSLKRLLKIKNNTRIS